ncbi:hypothetical protein [Blastococcus sp. TF02A-30]|nr:hypothetical protein [Blastococcus sp. TF02A-30]
MAVQDEVAAVEFYEETGLSADEIRAARRALDAERRARSTDRQ